MSNALIDADVLVFQVGFGVDHTYYTVGAKKYKYKKDAKRWADKHGIDYNEIIKHHEPGELAEAHAKIDEMMGGILDATGADRPLPFLSGRNNFRYSVGVSHPYKGNRNRSHKPHLYGEIRDYICERWGGQVVDGIEADDALGIHADEDSIICTIDKDLKQVPGWHYNWSTREFEQVDERKGAENFWTQMLTGDRTDNIFGPFLHTPAQERKARGMIGVANTPKEMASIVALEYIKAYEDSLERMMENGKLLYILRSEDDEFNL